MVRLLPALVAKRQKCGKKNCRCQILGELHGPYFWIVTYRRKQDRQNRGTYEWKYLGRSIERVLEKLTDENTEFFLQYGKEKVIQILNSNQSDKLVKSKVVLGKMEK